jgi:hypothetical protein
MPRMAWRRTSRSSSSHAVWRHLTRQPDVTRTAALVPATKSEASPLQALIAPQPYMGLSLSSTNFSAHAFFSLQHSSPFEIRSAFIQQFLCLAALSGQRKPRGSRRRHEWVDGANACRAIAVSLLRSRYVGNINSIRGGARLEWPSHRCHILIFGGNLDSGFPNHDADIRIGSEAPKQRCPFLYPA